MPQWERPSLIHLATFTPIVEGLQNSIMIGSASFLLSARRILKEFSQVRLNQLHSTLSLQEKQSGLLEQLYSDVDTAKILEFFNNKPAEDLHRHNFGSERLRHLIIDQRPFKSLADVLKIPRINIVQVEKLCKLVLNNDERSNLAPSRTSSCHPMIEYEQASAVKTVTSLRIHPQQSSWVTMTDELEFVQAGTHNMPYDGRKINLLKYDHVQYLEAVQTFAQQLPPSDAYLLFRQNFRLPGKTELAIGLNGGRNLLDATFSTMMATKAGRNNVYVMTYPDVASIFKINIGNEMVNADSTVDKLVESGAWKHHKLTALDTLQRQRLTHGSKRSSGHDPFSIPLLQCIGFITEVLYTARSPSSSISEKGEDNH